MIYRQSEIKINESPANKRFTGSRKFGVGYERVQSITNQINTQSRCSFCLLSTAEKNAKRFFNDIF